MGSLNRVVVIGSSPFHLPCVIVEGYPTLVRSLEASSFAGFLWEVLCARLEGLFVFAVSEDGLEVLPAVVIIQSHLLIGDAVKFAAPAFYSLEGFQLVINPIFRLGVRYRFGAAKP